MIATTQAVSEAFMPHGMCYLWEPELLWTHVLADTFTWLAYWAIPPALIYLVLRARREVPEGADYLERALPYDWVFWAFGAFIVACGGTHLMAVWTVWRPDYWVSGGVKVVTATASVATAVALPPLIPRILKVVHDARASDFRRMRLEEANEQLTELNRRLEEAETARARFFANVSHDLRTPLTLILGPTRELMESDAIGAEERDVLGSVEANARVLLGQVDELLDVARMEEGTRPVRISEADLAAVVQNVASNFRAVARSKDVDFKVWTPERLPALTDRRKVERIVLNLVANAFKHAPEGGTVRVHLGASSGPEDEGGSVSLVVEDSGPGIPVEERQRVFGRFERSDGATEDAGTGGWGLGLAIVRELATTLGGSVAVSDSQEGGARFEVRLPLRAVTAPDVQPAASGARHGDVRDPTEGAVDEVPAEEPEAVQDRAAAPESKVAPERGGRAHLGPEEPAGTVLVVEDNRDLAAYLARILAAEYRVHLSHDGAEGLELARTIGPDLILSDLMMPELDGEQLLARLREEPSLSAVPVIFLSARADRSLPARLLEAGAADYMVKPMEPAELRARVRNTLEMTRTRNILEEETGTRDGRLQEMAREVALQRRRLQRTVQEKQLVLQELHHRVKGNLQTVSSLLSLQARSVKDAEAGAALREAQGRLSAIALVHEKLYGGEQPTTLAMAEYLRGLADITLRSHVEADGRVIMEVRSDPVRLPVDRALPCALIAHELITNALTHAFPAGRPGRLTIELTRDPEDPDLLRLRIQDDGVGVPEGEARRGTGLELVQALAVQLGGTMEISKGEGTVAEVRFPGGAG